MANLVVTVIAVDNFYKWMLTLPSDENPPSFRHTGSVIGNLAAELEGHCKLPNYLTFRFKNNPTRKAFDVPSLSSWAGVFKSSVHFLLLWREACRQPDEGVLEAIQFWFKAAVGSGTSFKRENLQSYERDSRYCCPSTSAIGPYFPEYQPRSILR